MAEGGSALESSLTKNSGNNVPLKVILLGVTGVGKTSLFLRITKNEFYTDTSSKNADSLNHRITVNGRSVQMFLWDTAGMEKHERTLTRSYYLESQVALLVYSADDWDSVDDLKMYVDDIHNHAPGAKKFLIRNKIDLPAEEQTVSEKDVDDMFRKYGYHFAPEWKFKTSACTGKGIEPLLQEIGKVLLRQGSVTPDERNSFQVYKPKQTSSGRSKKSSSCC